MNIEIPEELINEIPNIKKIINNISELNELQKKTLDNIKEFYIKKNRKFQSKKELRKKFKAIRDNINSKKLEKKSFLLCNSFLSSDFYKDSDSIFCYISFGSEISTFKILEKCLSDKKKLSVPVISDNNMYPALINNLNNLKKNRFGIYEPEEYFIINKQEINITIVPGLVFNPLGFRLGYGGGFYDKFLSDYKNISVGLIFSEFLITYLIPEYFDKPVDHLFIL